MKTIDFGGTENEWQTSGGRSALIDAGLTGQVTGQVTVNYNVAFDDPFADIPGDPGEFVPCEHVDQDGDGRCDICDAVLSTDPSEPGEPEEPGDEKKEPNKPEEPGDDGDTSGDNSGGSSGSGSSTPIYGSNTLSNSGITLSGSDIHKDACLTVTPNKLHDGQCAECDQIRQWQKQGRVIAIYDVSISYGFRGTVTLTFPVSSTYNGKTLTVAHCLKDKLDTCDVAVSNGKVTVTADSLSPFAILDNSKDKPGKNNPDTGAGNPSSQKLPENVAIPLAVSSGISPWEITGLCALPAALLMGTAAVIIKRRRKMKAETPA